MSFTVAIDGPAAAGKGTISKAVAARFGLAHLDTGLLYRAVGCKVLETGDSPRQIAETLQPEDLSRDDLRSAKVAQVASKVAAIPEVRAALLAFQQDFAKRKGGAVLDGRDIGTVVCPNADVKLYVTASADTRAKRRFDELTAKGHITDYQTVLSDVKTRDARDSGRDNAPMKPADDAMLIDTTQLTIDEAIARAVEVVSQKLPG